jgi:hypothetical protein
MTAQQYLQSQAEHCRRAADDAADPFVAEELRRLAADFERRAQAAIFAASIVAMRLEPAAHSA